MSDIVLLLMHVLKLFNVAPRLAMEAMMLLDFATVTLISNEGSSLALLGPLIAAHS